MNFARVGVIGRLQFRFLRASGWNNLSGLRNQARAFDVAYRRGSIGSLPDALSILHLSQKAPMFA